ncbi:MAG: hypothetical protein AAFZ52_03565 [Bacteroidota bacterium]
MHFVKIFRLLAVFLVFFPGVRSSAQVVAPTDTYGHCVLDAHFEPIHHTGRRYLLHLLEQLAPAAGINPATYSVELIADRRGLEEINAMTCTGSRMIWLSEKAYTELVGHDVSLVFVMAHELAHGGAGQELLLSGNTWMSPADRELFARFNIRQYREVIFDLQAAEILLHSGYHPAAIVEGAAFILGQEGADHLLPATNTHPAGWDRVQLLSSYLSFRYAGGGNLATVGRVLPSGEAALSKR